MIHSLLFLPSLPALLLAPLHTADGSDCIHRSTDQEKREAATAAVITVKEPTGVLD